MRMCAKPVAGNSDSLRIEYFPIPNERREYNYVVMVTRFRAKYIWVRQRGRTTWELPGGHVEPNESPEGASVRELMEETGALAFTIEPVCDFSINKFGLVSYNRLSLARITSLGPLNGSEIEEVALFNEPPENLTHDEIQPMLLDRVWMWSSGEI